MIKVGITGGIGSGKSTIAKTFAALGIPVYFCDIEAKRLTETDRNIVSGLKALLGNDIYTPLGQLRRAEMAAMIFANKTLLAQVNRLIHPVVLSDFERWAVRQKDNGAPWVLCEAAVLVESGLIDRVDRVIVATLPTHTRIKRTMLRDKLSFTDVSRRVNNQLDNDQLIKHADYVISPDDTHFILPSIINICQELSV
ncbi:MAG: dephospho-CoA kinase [Bacteroidales bacterium]|nr:dephospho-CoA kinase [Bacteroidales bacterium]